MEQVQHFAVQGLTLGSIMSLSLLGWFTASLLCGGLILWRGQGLKPLTLTLDNSLSINTRGGKLGHILATSVLLLVMSLVLGICAYLGQWLLLVLGPLELGLYME